jgi:phage gp16-like protein
MGAPKKESKPQIKRIWGLAKNIGLEKEPLYDIIEALTGKRSMTQCRDEELDRVVKRLVQYKSNQQRDPKMANEKLIWKIRQLEKELGWADNPQRLKGFMRKYAGVENLKWLKTWQAHKLIEGLKKMVEKMEV